MWISGNLLRRSLYSASEITGFLKNDPAVPIRERSGNFPLLIAKITVRISSGVRLSKGVASTYAEIPGYEVFGRATRLSLKQSRVTIYRFPSLVLKKLSRYAKRHSLFENLTTSSCLQS